MSLPTTMRTNRSRQRIIYVDLTDLVSHCWHNSTISGIQRVQLEVAVSLIRNIDDARAFCLINNHYIDLSAWLRNRVGRTIAEIYHDFRKRFGHFASPNIPVRTIFESVAYFVEQLKVRSRTFRYVTIPEPGPEPGDLIYIGGAFWADQHSIPFFNFVVDRGVRLLLMIHDVIPLTHPEYVGPAEQDHFRKIFRLPIDVIANSKFTAGDIARAIDQTDGAQKPMDIQIVPLAQEYSGWERNHRCDAEDFPKLADRIFRGREATGFVLTVGTVELRKNQAALVGLWNRLNMQIEGRMPVLVLAGRRGWNSEGLLAQIESAPPDHPVVFIEAPTDTEMVWLYSHCIFTVFPSMFEGWGLPVGESLWFGKPCIASNATSVPEVGGTLCDYADSANIDSFADPILRYITESDVLESRTQAILAAKLRRWDEVSGEIVAITQKVAEDHNPVAPKHDEAN